MYLIGQSQDLHNLVPGRKLMLGGIEIKSHLGLLGESDADVLLHAITEAIIGSIQEGDLGTHFGEDVIHWPNADSVDLLKYALSLLEKKSYELVNIDSLIICQEILIKPHRLKMIKKISQITGCDKVNVKATTNEGNDAIGKGKAIAAQAVVLVKEKE